MVRIRNLKSLDRSVRYLDQLDSGFRSYACKRSFIIYRSVRYLDQLDSGFRSIRFLDS